MTTNRPLGQKFSQVYLDRSVPTGDGKRWRHRLATYVQEELQKDSKLASKFGRNLGVEVINQGYSENYYNYASVLRNIEIHLLLDACTLIFSYLNDINGNSALNWKAHFETSSIEENVSYVMDEKGGVHPAVDVEFQHNLASTIRGLDAPRYRAALTAFSGIQPALDRGDTRDGIRKVFDAAENIVNIMTGAKGLDANVVKRQLNNKIKENWEGAAAKATANQMVAGFVNWVNAAHSYRHIEGHPDAAAPPMDLTILMISVGASYIRWLIDQDQQVQQNQPDSPSV